MGVFQRRDKLSDSIGIGMGIPRPHRYTRPPAANFEGSMAKSPSPALTLQSVQIPIRSKSQIRNLKPIVDEKRHTELKTLSPSAQNVHDSHRGNFRCDLDGDIETFQGSGDRPTSTLKPRFLEQMLLLAQLDGADRPQSSMPREIDQTPQNVTDQNAKSPESAHLPIPSARTALHGHMVTASNGTNVSAQSAASQSMTYLTASSIGPPRTNTSTNSSSNFDSWTSTDSLDLAPPETDIEEVLGEDDYFIYKSSDGAATERIIEFLNDRYVE